LRRCDQEMAQCALLIAPYAPLEIQSAVIAGLVPATPTTEHGRALLSGVAGTSPAMTPNMSDRAV
jgi:hypothetical protein